MNLFIRRFIGALVLDPGTYEDIESDRRAGAMAMVVVGLTCAAGAFAAMSVSALGMPGFAIAMVVVGLTCAAGAFAAMSVSALGMPGFAIAMAMAIGGWILWASLISAIGTRMLPEPQTKSNPGELFRTIGFAAAPGSFYAFAAMPAAMPFVFVLVSVWMIAATVLAVRQALDFRSTGRAVAVCVIAWLLSMGLVAAVGTLFTRPVS